MHEQSTGRPWEERVLNSGERTRDSESKGSVLIVDDEDPVRQVFKRILERNHYICSEASSGDEAREWLCAHSCDLVLCDIRMPGESGLELVRFVKSEYPEVGVIMVTGVDDMQTAREALSLDIYGYVLKPVHQTQILINVATGMRRHHLEIEQRASRESLERLVADRTLDLRKTNRILKTREADLEKYAKELEELNSALRVLLRKTESDKRIMKEDILANVKKTIIPYLEKLKCSHLTDRQRQDLHIVEANILEMVSPFARELSAAPADLTPCEMQVANLIKLGKGTKEIASILNLSANTIMTHRYKIRTKLGLKNSKQNLRSFLGSIPNQ
jgi:DNA-binding NarL/FixJ family response regulator